MTKKELKEFAMRYTLLECDIEASIEFVSDLLEKVADEIKESEPYATNTIKRMEDAACEVYDLLYYVQELEE